MTDLSERFGEAFAYAAELHREHWRKGTDIPYVAHLMAVSALVLEHGGDEDQAIAALLHDAVEDQGGVETADEIQRRFGDRVVKIVLDCTDAYIVPKPPWRERKEAYLAALEHKAEASILVSLADKVHNSESIARDHAVLGDEIWDRFRGGKDGTLWYYRALSEVFQRRAKGPLADILSETVRHLDGGRAS